MRQNENMESVLQHPITTTIIWLIAIYATVLGLKLFINNKGDSRGLGFGLLIAVVGWAGIEVGWEYVPSVDIGNPDKISTLSIPVLRTVQELGMLMAAVSFTLVVLSNLFITLKGSDLIRLQKALLRFGLWVLGLSIIYQGHFAGQYSIKTVVIGIGGALVFVVGLGLQRTLTNLFSGFDLQADRVFQKGDMVQIGVGGLEGMVWDTSLRSTRIYTLDGQMLIVANGELLSKEVLNLDHPTRALRVRRNVGISYTTPPMRAKDVMLQVLRQDSAVLNSPAPVVFLTSYGDSSINYELRFWVADRRVLDENVDSVLSRVWYALRESDIEIPFPLRTIRMVDMKTDAQHISAGEEHVLRIEQIVAKCPLFDESHMNSSERRELARDAQEVELKAGEFAVRQGEESDHLYLIVRGSVRVLRKGKEPIEVHAPHGFGEMALLLNQPRSADVMAGDSGAALLRFSKSSVLPVLKRRPEFAKELRQISDERRLASGLQNEMQRKLSFPERVAGLIQRIAASLKPW
ncbi:MAG: mechanosensitive ion channel [Phycisphaerales bacterium]|nr:mechanosensitive ion channel [Phycisphaerales bacterium]